MPSRGIPASFWRGGTSRGLILRAEHLAPYLPAARDRIISTALGSPDPNGRQIGGLGGGVSSLSKAMIIGTPGEGIEAQREYGRLPGPEWADDGKRKGLGEWDIVYRFAQVPIKSADLDWTATCGNMLSAVAVHALATPILPYTTIFSRARSLTASGTSSPVMFPLSILSASSGSILRARVPIHPWTLQPWEPPAGSGVEIAGVPGEAAGIEVELPMEGAEDAAGGSGLVTGRAIDRVAIGDQMVPVSIVTAGLPNIFVTLESLGLEPSLLTAPSSMLSSDANLNQRVEDLRQAAAAQAGLNCSLSSPKVTLVGALPSGGYSTSSGGRVDDGDVDLVARSISSGDWHATIPGTSLGALNVAWGTPGTVVHALRKDSASVETQDVVTVRAGHAAGAVSSSVRFETDGATRKPVSVVMMRTAREIMRGEVRIDESVLI